MWEYVLGMSWEKAQTRCPWAVLAVCASAGEIPDGK